MSLYVVEYEGEQVYVEAPSYEAAAKAYRLWWKQQVGDNEDQPGSITFVTNNEVVR